MRNDNQEQRRFPFAQMAGRTGVVVSMARRGLLVALGGSALVADASGKLFARAATAGERQVRRARSRLGLGRAKGKAR